MRSSTHAAMRDSGQHTARRDNLMGAGKVPFLTPSYTLDFPIPTIAITAGSRSSLSVLDSFEFVRIFLGPSLLKSQWSD
jgi:hypothetical protein